MSQLLITSFCNGNTQHFPNKTTSGYIHDICNDDNVKDKVTTGCRILSASDPKKVGRKFIQFYQFSPELYCSQDVL